MKKIIYALFFIFIAAFAFSKAQKEIIQPDELKKILEQHPLVEKADIYEVSYFWTLKSFYYEKMGREQELPYTFDLDLVLTNGHTVSFKEIPNSLSFREYGSLRYINNVLFWFTEKGNQSGVIRIKDLCKATNTNYYDLYSILNNYNDFCRLLNTIPYARDDTAEKMGIEYSGGNYVYLYRWSKDKAFEYENKFIEIPEE